MSTNTETTFIRRKFTITEELDAELERMASNNYQGNVSLCLRQAITDYRNTLNGNGDLTIRRLTESVAYIEDQVSELEQSISEITDQQRSADGDLSKMAGGSEANVQSGAAEVMTVLETTDTPLRVADIIERVAMQPIDVRSVLGGLVDDGHVFASPTDPPRYYLAKIDASHQGRNSGEEKGQ